MTLKDTLGKASKDPVMKYVIWALYIGLAIAVVIVIYKIYQAYKTGVSAVGDITGTAINAAQSGVDASRIETCKEVAEAVQNAHSVYLFGLFTYNHTDQIVAALNRLVTDKEAILTSAYYRQNTGRSLKADITDIIFNGWQSQINELIFNNLS